MAWLPREGLPSRCPGCTSSTEAESESESCKTENSPTFKYFCKESWEAFCTSSWRWFVLSKDCILFCSYLCGIKFYSQLQVDFLPSSFPTKSTVLSQDICGRKLHDSFIMHFFFQFSWSSDIATSALNVDFLGEFHHFASWPLCEAEGILWQLHPSALPKPEHCLLSRPK